MIGTRCAHLRRTTTQTNNTKQNTIHVGLQHVHIQDIQNSVCNRVAWGCFRGHLLGVIHIPRLILSCLCNIGPDGTVVFYPALDPTCLTCLSSASLLLAPACTLHLPHVDVQPPECCYLLPSTPALPKSPHIIGRCPCIRYRCIRPGGPFFHPASRRALGLFFLCCLRSSFWVFPLGKLVGRVTIPPPPVQSILPSPVFPGCPPVFPGLQLPYSQ